MQQTGQNKHRDAAHSIRDGSLSQRRTYASIAADRHYARLAFPQASVSWLNPVADH